MRNVLRPDHMQAYRECYKIGLNNQGFFSCKIQKALSAVYAYITIFALHVIRAKCYTCVFTFLILRATHTPSQSKTLMVWLQNYMQYISEHSSFNFRLRVHLKTFLSITSLPFNCLRSNKKANIQISEVLILR